MQVFSLLTLNIFIIWSSLTTARPFLKKEQLLTEDLPPQGFGKFYVTIRFFEKCTSGAVDKKNQNIHNLIVKKHNETFEEFEGFLTIPNTHKCTLAKFTPMVKRNGILKPTLNRTVENPCRDILMSIPMTMIFHTDDSCVLHKGNYTAKNIDPNKWAHLTLGDNFMYERIHSTLEYFTKNGNTFCLYIVLDIRPIPKFKKKRKL